MSNMQQVTATAGEVVVPKDEGCWMIRYYDSNAGQWCMYEIEFTSKRSAESIAESRDFVAYRIVRIPGEEVKDAK